MKKLVTIIAALVLLNAKAQTPTPFTSEITNTSGNLISPHFARICPSTAGSATLQATAGWPFGIGYNGIIDLHIAIGNTITIPCGVIADYNSITIDSGGVLQISAGNLWTYIGCRGPFILNGTIVGKQGTYHSGTYTANEPAADGSLTGTALSYTVVQQNGGNGGSSGVPACNNPPVYYGASYAGGNQFNGNGGGGAGAMNIGHSCSIGGGGIGTDATDTTSGAGTMGGGETTVTTPAVGLYGQNGNNSPDAVNVTIY
jgi:hypothetical protein